MAKIVLGMATSHAPSLNGSPDRWAAAGERDMQGPTGGGMPMNVDLDALVRDRASWIGKELRQEVFDRRHRVCQKAIGTLSETLKRVSPAVVVIVGDDTHEVFMPEDHIPAVDVFWGEEIRHLPHGSRRGDPEGVPNILRGEPDLGRHLIESLNADGFDVSHTRAIPEGRSIGHAFDFVYARIMDNKVPPHVPVFLNTYYAPNQPTLRRCYQLGKGLRRAIESWARDKTVAIVGTGGLSHMVIDEDLDREVLAGVGEKDEARLARLPEERFNFGTGEIRNWLATAGAFHESGASMKLVAYEPCYRSRAGTGCACAFAYWQ
jgi:hypothetical protein